MTGLPITGAFIILNVTSVAKRRAARTLPSAGQREEEVSNEKNAMAQEFHTGFLSSGRATGTQICLKSPLRWS
jgi:hypothetical protein